MTPSQIKKWNSIGYQYVIKAYDMYCKKPKLNPNDMGKATDLLQKCKIKGLKLTPDSVRKVKNTMEYSYIQLDSLLIYHGEKLKSKLIDDLFFHPETLAVIEYKGNTYAVQTA